MKTTTSRLDAVLTRNRKHLIRDLALAAFLPLAVLFAGVAVGSQLPKLSSAVHVAADTDTTRG